MIYLQNSLGNSCHEGSKSSSSEEKYAHSLFLTLLIIIKPAAFQDQKLRAESA